MCRHEDAHLRRFVAVFFLAPVLLIAVLADPSLDDVSTRSASTSEDHVPNPATTDAHRHRRSSRHQEMALRLMGAASPDDGTIAEQQRPFFFPDRALPHDEGDIMHSVSSRESAAEEDQEVDDIPYVLPEIMKRRGFGGRPKEFAGGNRARGPGQRNRFDPGLKMIGLGKREHKPPKYDPGWKFIGLGKRQIRDDDEMDSAFAADEDAHADSAFPIHGHVRRRGADPSLARSGLSPSDIPRPTDAYNPYLSILALSNLSDFFQELKEELRSPKSQDRRMIARSREAALMRSPDGMTGLNRYDNQAADGDIRMGGADDPLMHTLYTRSTTNILGPNRKNTERRPKFDPAWMLTGLGK